MSFRLVCAAKPHKQKVAGMGFQPGLDPVKVFNMALNMFTILYALLANFSYLSVLHICCIFISYFHVCCIFPDCQCFTCR